MDARLFCQIETGGKRYEKERYDNRERNAKKLFLEETFSFTVHNIHKFNKPEPASNEVMNVIRFIREEIINKINPLIENEI